MSHRKLAVLFIAFAAACAARAGFLYQAEMTVSGYAGATELSGFPVLVRISANTPSGFNYALCQADGKDIAFFSPDGETAYPHEIEKWDISGTSLIWVRVPALSGTGTKFLFRFGDASITSAPESKGAWASSAGGFYAGVWHFADAVSTGSEKAADSAKHDEEKNLDLTPKGSTAYAVSTAGKVGTGRVNTTDGSQAVYYETSLSASFDPINTAPNFTVSGWFKINHWRSEFTTGKRMRVIGRSTDGYSGDNAWCVDFQSQNDTARAYGRENTRANPKMPHYQDMEWFHLALVYTTEGVTCYTNGVLSSTTGGIISSNNTKNLRLGYPNQIVSDPTSYYGNYDELRILKAAASADWVAAEFAAAARTDFVTAGVVEALVSDVFYIESSGERVGTVDPVYGQYSGALGEGTQIVCTAAAALIDVSEELKTALRGWKLYGFDSDNTVWTNISEGVENSCSYTHNAGNIRKLEWQQVNLRPVTLAANRTVTYLINGEAAAAGTNWVQEGVVTVTAVTSSGVEGVDFAFAGWSGDTAGAAGGAGSTNITLQLSGAVSLTAKYATLHYVSATAGSDSTGAGTRASPWATINFAINSEAVAPGDEIRIAGGLYVESVSNTNKPQLAFRGGYKSDWARDLKGCPTTIKAPDSAWNTRGTTFWLGDGAPSNRIEGVVVCNGQYGIRVNNPFGQRIDKVIATNNVVTGIYFPWWTGLKSGHFDHVVISSSLIAFNGDPGCLGSGMANYGIQGADYNTFVPSMHILNCTVVSNGTSGVSLGFVETDIRNTIIANNGWAESRVRPFDYEFGLYGLYFTVMRNSAVWNRKADRGISLYKDVSTTYCRLYYPVNLYSFDPKLADDLSLSDLSPLIKRGEDLDQTDFPVTEDVYGNAWISGEYDIGCFKSNAAKSHAVTYSDVYVAADGDDANTGADAEHPLKSLGLGAALTADNGTLHVGPGEYDEFVVLNSSGMTLRGAGPDATVITGASSTNGIAVYVATNNVTVRDLAIRNSRIGIYLANRYCSSNALVENCRLSRNQIGLYQSTETAGYPSSSWTTPACRFSHMLVEDSGYGATYFYALAAPAVFDSCLFARNGKAAGAIYGGPYFSATKQYFYNCSFASNSIYAVFSDNGGNVARDVAFYNCILAGSPVGWKCNGAYGRGASCIFDCETNYFFTSSLGYWQTGKTNRFFEVDAMLNWSVKKYARPLAGSVAATGGININGSGADALVDVTTDLDYAERPLDKWFIGCYVPPAGGFLVTIR